MPKPPRKPLSEALNPDDPASRADLARSAPGRAFIERAHAGRPSYAELTRDDPSTPTRPLSVRVPPSLFDLLGDVAKDRRKARAAPFTQAAIVAEALARWMVANGYADGDDATA